MANEDESRRRRKRQRQPPGRDEKRDRPSWTALSRVVQWELKEEEEDGEAPSMLSDRKPAESEAQNRKCLHARLRRKWRRNDSGRLGWTVVVSYSKRMRRRRMRRKRID